MVVALLAAASLAVCPLAPRYIDSVEVRFAKGSSALSEESRSRLVELARMSSSDDRITLDVQAVSDPAPTVGPTTIDIAMARRESMLEVLFSAGAVRKNVAHGASVTAGGNSHVIIGRWDPCDPVQSRQEPRPQPVGFPAGVSLHV